MKKRSLILLVVWAIALMVNVFPAQAGLGVWTTRLYAVNISGQSDGYSGKMVNGPIGGQWGANIVTMTQYPAVVLYMGWNYFSGTEYCGPEPVQNLQGDPRYISTSQTANTIYLTKIGCDYTRYAASNGKHIITAGGTDYFSEWQDKQPMS